MTFTRKYLQLKPHTLVYLRYANEAYRFPQLLPVETISYETPDETIMVRLIPNDPSTLLEVKISDLRRLPTTDRPKWVQYAEVSPKFQSHEIRFPTDMLRYDNSVPINFTIGDDELVTMKPGETKLVVARCACLKRVLHTEARYHSFGWNCRHLDSVKIS